MRRSALIGAALLIGGCRPHVALPAADWANAASMRLENGYWFDGKGFHPATVEVRGSRLHFVTASAAPLRAPQTIDLKGGFVIPPFCEAHSHNLGVADPSKNWSMNARYLADGVFYVQVLANMAKFAGPWRTLLNRPGTVDVVFANGGLTGSGGHPIPLSERLLREGRYPGYTRETLKDDRYFIIDSVADIDRVWHVIERQRPDIVKVFLLYSEEYEKRRYDNNYTGAKGLNPAFAPIIVRRARAFGLRTVFHVASAHDFRVVVDAGAHQIAHLPGVQTVQRVRRKDAVRAARRGTFVQTTARLIERHRKNPAYLDIRASQIQNLKLLKETGVRVIVGSDDAADTLVAEVEHIRRFNLFSNRELLRMWGEACSQAVFPNRRVGRLENGYEASFLVLAGNPLFDFGFTKRIRLAVKDGVVLRNYSGSRGAATSQRGRTKAV